ncbi:hypothetical protein M3Y98_00645900 [Aphelenchoides besseyi]|nr:hypothetical protein M3Y98_00645900 [Aphelenchoides besseyi]
MLPMDSIGVPAANRCVGTRRCSPGPEAGGVIAGDDPISCDERCWAATDMDTNPEDFSVEPVINRVYINRDFVPLLPGESGWTQKTMLTTLIHELVHMLGAYVGVCMYTHGPLFDLMTCFVLERLETAIGVQLGLADIKCKIKSYIRNA